MYTPQGLRITCRPPANQGKSGMPLYPAISAIISRQRYNPPSDLIIRYNSINQYTTLEILTVQLSYYIPYHQQCIPPDTGVRGYNQVYPPTTSASLTRPYIRLEVLRGVILWCTDLGVADPRNPGICTRSGWTGSEFTHSIAVIQKGMIL